MNEQAARDVALVRAIETADSAREAWTDDDRAWALRTAGEIVGENAPSDVFVERRAALVLERLRGRFPRIAMLSALPAWRGWLVAATAIVAFVVGVAGADVGASRTINLLAPPVLLVIAWNLAVYALLAAAALPRRARRPPGPLRAVVARWLRGAIRPVRARVTPPPLARALQRFATDWPVLAMPLWQQRVARLLHVGAACLALGMIAGLYLRGIALEFRVTWQSTFLGAEHVARILHVVLAPGAWLSGIAVPDASRLRAIAASPTGENAAPWIHLYAATLVLAVVAPRLVLAAVAWLRERRLATRFPVDLGAPYFARLVRGWREGAASVVVVPYSFDVPPASRDGLARLLARAHAGGVDVGWLPPVRYGDDPPALAPGAAGVVALFNLAATPERESHGAFVEALRADAPGVPLVAIVDASPFAERFGDDARRMAERERAWRGVLEAAAADPLFVRLAAPESLAADADLSRRLERIA